MATLSYNQGEWSEVYIFFKVIADRKLYTADADFNPIKDVYLDVISVIREEVKNEVYKYMTGDTVTILLNHEPVGSVPVSEFIKYKNILWKLLEENTQTTFSSDVVEKFLNSIHIFNPKSPAHIVSKFCGGTVDIVVETKDRSGVNRILGFSCKSDLRASSTLLNASGDNTNFVFEVTGPMDDEKMQHFNNLFKKTKRKGEICYDIATSDRMQYLHEIGCDLQFVDTAKTLAKTNLIKCGGKEMPEIVAGMLKKFYFENLSGPTTVKDCIEYLADNDVAEYGFDDLKDTYRGKVAHFLLCTFTGMRLGSPWNGRQDVNGGYIVVKNNGDVVAFHSTIADEFKDFLVAKMIMESPSHSRHKDMVIYKDGDHYYLKLGLQLRFSLSR
ncbi:MAG: HpaII family restriction endonuclease [Lachnospiraceae bacterium]|nr:HpaII family restriction endonuclease [Lachnospiraceae bacterium]